MVTYEIESREASRELQSYDPIDSHKALNHMTWAIVKTTWTLEPPSKWALYAKHVMNAPCQIAPYSLVFILRPLQLHAHTLHFVN